MLGLLLPSHHWLWNDLLPWLEPASTAVGVCAAIVAAIYAARVYRRESDRDQRWEDRERRAQAALVSS
ncbi:MAG: hypothetical protein WB797_13160, partial [Nocardioides sp.]